MTTNTPAGAGAASLACTLGAIPADERPAHARLLTTLFAATRERRPLPDGYAYRFDADAFDDLARWIANERRCCPFLTVQLTLAADGPVWLRLTGPEGTRAFLDAELSAARRATTA